MSLIPEKELDELRSRADIVQVIGEKIPLKRSGRSFKGLCPFHAEKTPSFMVNQEKQIYHCFGCGEGGNIISFVMKYEGLDFVQSVERLADRFGVTLTNVGGRDEEGAKDQVRRSKAEKELLWRINQLACRFFYENLQGAVGQRGCDYLNHREIKGTMIREALLGFAPGDGKSLTRLLFEKKVPLEAAERLGLVRQNQPRRGDERGDASPYYDFFRDRLIFSIISAEGKVLGFSGRALGEEVQPKYLNSPESPIYHKGDSLLGIHLARGAIREKDQVILVEGNFDLIRLHQEGIRNVVAPLGTALTEQQVRVLARTTQNFVLLFDGDEAGLRAADRALEIFLPLGILPRAVLLPKGEDPDSFVRKEGVEPLKNLLDQAPLLLDIRIEHIFTKAGRSPQGEGKAVREIVALLSKLPGEIEKRLYIQRVAEKTGLSEGLLLKEISPQQRGGRGRAKKESNFFGTSGDDRKRPLPPIERTILELLLSGHGNPKILFEEIAVGDFSDPELGKIWQILKEDYERNDQFNVARLLSSEASGLQEESLRRLVTELSVSGSRWKLEEEDERAGIKAATDCVRQVRVTRIKERMKGLSQEIRRAELVSDSDRVQELLGQKNRLVKEMMSLH